MSSRFVLYDPDLGSIETLPTRPWDVRFIDSFGLESILFRSDGKNCATRGQRFPFLIECSRFDEHKGGFVSKELPLDLPISEETTIGLKRTMLVIDIRPTTGGIEILFGPREGKEVEFSAGDVFPPLTSMTYLEKGNQLVLNMQKVNLGPGLRNKKLEGENLFVRGITLEETEEGTQAVISLAEAARYYRGSIQKIRGRIEMPLLAIIFSSEPRPSLW